MQQSIFQQACLIQLQTSCWHGSRMLEPTLMEPVGNIDWIKGRKNLVNPEILNPIKAVVSRARNFLKKSALPFPINGLSLVPKEAIFRMEDALREHQAEFNEAVEEFTGKYGSARLEAQANLGELFDEADYPINIRERFGFEWRFLTLDVPKRSTILAPEVYEREKAKFEAMMQETRELCVAALREEFAEIVTHMVDRLNNQNGDKPKVFKSSMVEKMNEFLDGFGYRNLFEDQQLAELVEDARALVEGVSPEEIRENNSIRRRITSGMKYLKSAIDQALEDLPRRKIRLAA